VQSCYEPESSSGELRAGSFATVRSDSSTRLSVMLSGSSTLEWFAFTGGGDVEGGAWCSVLKSTRRAASGLHPLRGGRFL